MKCRIESKSARYALIAFTAATLLPPTGFAKPKPIMTTDILQHLRKGEPWDRGVFTATKMVMFQQASSSGTDATSIAKITLSYFTSPDCTATNGTIVPTYTTPNGTSFTINTTTPFGMVAASAWNVGNSKVSPTISTTYPGNDITNIQSIAVTLKSSNNNTPQASFTGISFACVPVTCRAGECTSDSGTQSFQLKTTAAVGDPADGGVIGCQNTGVAPNLFNIVVTTSDQGTTQGWGGSGFTTGAISTTDGAANTTRIVAALGTGSSYAARTCKELSVTGGFTNGWFLPSGGSVNGTQLNCIWTNSSALGISIIGIYWSSTENSSTRAWRIRFSDGQKNNDIKTALRSVRCARNF